MCILETHTLKGYATFQRFLQGIYNKIPFSHRYMFNALVIFRDGTNLHLILLFD